MSEEFQKLHEVILGNRHQISPKVTGTTYEDDLKSLQMFFAAHDGVLKACDYLLFSFLEVFLL